MQRAVLAYVRSEPGGLSGLSGLSGIDGTRLATSVTGLARVVYGAEEPSDAQRAAVRRAVRRLEAGDHVEVHRLRVGRTYTQQRAHPHFWPPRYDRRLAVCIGKDGCPVELDCHFESICESCTLFVTTIEFRPTLERQRDDAAAKGQVAREQIFDGLLSRPTEKPPEQHLSLFRRGLVSCRGEVLAHQLAQSLKVALKLHACGVRPSFGGLAAGGVVIAQVAH
ncbi:hypothetical protein ABZ490_46250 [Streptomyces sp. NPDC005811]|uniref:hypothetical protein n=1 Tax=Streptomyces sp. NPDC005811 TaxID=3154565 RepID=UPI0033DBC270